MPPGGQDSECEIPAAGYLAPLEQAPAVGRALAEFLESMG